VILLFSYGTLQQEEVQRANYGRLLQGAPDTLAGYRLDSIEIADPRVVSLSGKAMHTIARYTGDPADRIAGTRFEISADELAATDSYEVEDYERTEVMLESGRPAFCYLRRPKAAE
jgi:hypothetical protein